MPAPAPPFIPAEHFGRGGNKPIKRIVIHGTVSGTYCGGARNIAEYFQNPSYVSSAHYVVDPCETFQCVWDSDRAWHDGTNTHSLGVEMCDPVEGPLSRWNDRPHSDMLRRTANLVAGLCDAYGIPKRKLTPAQIRNGHKGICGHDDMRDAFPGSTSHWDPGAFPWSRFIALVKNGSSEDDLQFNDKFKDWAGNPQTFYSWMMNVDRRVYELTKAVEQLPGETWRVNVGNPWGWDGQGDKPDEDAWVAVSYGEQRGFNHLQNVKNDLWRGIENKHAELEAMHAELLAKLDELKGGDAA